MFFYEMNFKNQANKNKLPTGNKYRIKFGRQEAKMTSKNLLIGNTKNQID